MVYFARPRRLLFLTVTDDFLPPREGLFGLTARLLRFESDDEPRGGVRLVVRITKGS
jgi:hypothetical protein